MFEHYTRVSVKAKPMQNANIERDNLLSSDLNMNLAKIANLLLVLQSSRYVKYCF